MPPTMHDDEYRQKFHTSRYCADVAAFDDIYKSIRYSRAAPSILISASRVNDTLNMISCLDERLCYQRIDMQASMTR